MPHWDPAPYLLLNSGLAIACVTLMPFIQMSQNRQSQKDRITAQIDHQVNIKNEVGIAELRQRMAEIQTQLQTISKELTTSKKG